MLKAIPSLVGSLAVIMIVVEFIRGSNMFTVNPKGKQKIIEIVLAGVIGGFLGVYANLTGVEYEGAYITVRDIGPILSGYVAGPLGGLLGGYICGLHRYTMGGPTAQACIAATCLIGLVSGMYFDKHHNEEIGVWKALSIGAVMEMLHMGMVLLLVKPYDVAEDIVREIAVPFILVNSIGFALIVVITKYMDKQKQLLQEKSRIDSELDTAKVIQLSLLPPINEEYPFVMGRHTFDIDSYIKPARKVGGDFYDFFFIDDDHFAFLIADVSGKGIAAAMFMANAKMTLENGIRDIDDLAEAVAKCNNSLCKNNDAQMFVTAWIGVLDLKTKKVNYVSAGHNPPVLIHDNTAEYIRIKNSFILGGMEDMMYKVNELQLESGDILYLYTDGVSEATNKDEVLYGEERLQEVLNTLKDPSAHEVISAVDNGIKDFVQGYEQADDITMLAVKIK